MWLFFLLAGGLILFSLLSWVVVFIIDYFNPGFYLKATARYDEETEKSKDAKPVVKSAEDYKAEQEEWKSVQDRIDRTACITCIHRGHCPAGRCRGYSQQ